MPKDLKKDRVKSGVQKLRANEEIQDPFFDMHSSPAAVGEIFQIVADSVEDLKQTWVAKAFSDAGLSPQNPFHWGYLMQNFAEAHYRQFEGGRPKTRIQNYVYHFRRTFAMLQRELPDATKEKLFAQFLERFGGRPPFTTLKKVSGVRTAYYELEKKRKRSRSGRKNLVKPRSK
jgi:hypothetical protein